MLIQHCATTSNKQGGIQTYVNSLLRNQPNRTEQGVINLLEGMDQSRFSLLHLHDPKQLRALSGACPSVFTLHNHSTYCPSGTKYLATRQTECGRVMSPAGCLWGHMVDGCGSRRPRQIMQGLQTSYEELALVERKAVPVIAVSHYARQQLINQGISPNQVTTVHHGIDLPALPVLPLTLDTYRQQRLLFVGRIVPQKGLDTLLLALAQTTSTVCLDIAGEGWFRPQLEGLVRRLDLHHRVVWHDWCNSEQLEQLYQQCFAVVFPSLWPEPAGLITLEAYARQRPVIATQVGGIPEYVVANKTGMLVPSNQPEALATAINSLSSDFPRCLDLAENGYDYLQERFTIQHHLKSLDQVYEKVASPIQGLR